MKPRALITGIAGQDGSYLAEFLLARGYEVHGLVRGTKDVARSWIAGIADQLTLHRGDISDPVAVGAAVTAAAPREVYHLAAHTHVAQSEDDPEETLRQNVLATLHLLEALRRLPQAARLFHASTSLVFGQPTSTPQDESTPIQPVNRYGHSKALATGLVRHWREGLGQFAVNGILYNHESPRRGEGFVTSKVCRAAAAIAAGRQKGLQLGNLASVRDWGDAREFVRGYWLSLQADQPGDYVFATGQPHSVEELLGVAFGAVGLDWRDHVVSSPDLLRATDPNSLVGNPAKAARELGWVPRTPFATLVREMVAAAQDELRS